ncbi:hypothetical protein FH972_009540 [Carpinus fangiana]|uniref:Pectinesterase catalytic domain-containing protein n=1 Tax=Carpinus fangiana TaxID=176857 RepID=A0A660KNB4_9ROSI|nr:hypothetical protein FH972_009540 [Carpinus fangiana]
MALEDCIELIGSKPQTLAIEQEGQPNDAPCVVGVAKDGSWQYASINAALSAYPDGHKGRYLIYVKSGVYEENDPDIHIVKSTVSQTSSTATQLALVIQRSRIILTHPSPPIFANIIASQGRSGKRESTGFVIHGCSIEPDESYNRPEDSAYLGIAAGEIFIKEQS